MGRDLDSEKAPAAEVPQSLLARAILVLDVLAEHGSCTTADLLQLTEVPRPTLYRLLRTLEKEHLTVRDASGRHRVGLRALAWAASLQTPSALVELVRPILLDLRERTGESVQLYAQEGNARVCVASFEPSSGLRVTVPTGAVLPLHLGSGGKAFLPWAADGDQYGVSAKALATIKARGWAESVAEREVGVASVAAPILDDAENVRAVLAVSGPADRFGTHPGSMYGEIVRDAALEAARILRAAGVIS
jgi:DNA-binding IclR family transcriptional regulator